jgi:hypothetical protein
MQPNARRLEATSSPPWQPQISGKPYRLSHQNSSLSFIQHYHRHWSTTDQFATLMTASAVPSVIFVNYFPSVRVWLQSVNKNSMGKVKKVTQAITIYSILLPANNHTVKPSRKLYTEKRVENNTWECCF